MVLQLADKVSSHPHTSHITSSHPHTSHITSSHPTQATDLVTERLVALDQSKQSDKEKEARVRGILNQIITNNATLHVAFPIHRSDPVLVTAD